MIRIDIWYPKSQAVRTLCNHVYEIFYCAEKQMFPIIVMMDSIISTAMYIATLTQNCTNSFFSKFMFWQIWIIQT